MANWSQTWTFFGHQWHEGNPPMMGPRSHGAWLGSTVFDGARVFDGVAPDLDKHCARVNRSAVTLGLKATQSVDKIMELTLEGAKKFSEGTALYVKPMYWGEGEGFSTIVPDPEDTAFALCLFAAPMPSAATGFSLTLSPYRRPTIESMPTDAKAGCLYPNNARVLRDAKARGFTNALVRDALGHIAETATSNIFYAKDGVVFTPAANSSFLNGITRQRVLGLLRQDGVEVVEKALLYADFESADEIFSVGNYGKVVHVAAIDERVLQPGPLFRRSREVYMDFAHSV